VKKEFTMKGMKDVKVKFTELAHTVIGSSIEVHKELGPGLLESTYQRCLAHELKLRGIHFQKEHVLPVTYKELQLDCGYRIDLLVENEIIVELKSVEAIMSIHEAQLLTYMKLAEIKHGLLINFNVHILKQGLKSFLL
jgi:GxxExxY protein